MFAKRSINEEKKIRHEEDVKRRRLKESLDAEFRSKPPVPKTTYRKPSDHASSPSTEASNDPAPSGHSTDNGGQGVAEEGKYIATKPYRSRKGDRFS